LADAGLPTSYASGNGGRYSGASRGDYSEVKPMALGFGGIIAIFSGIWGAVFRSRRISHWLLNFLLFVSGYVAIVFSVFWLCVALTENASASLGSFGVSAPTYGRAEDVRVVAVVVSELKFRNVQRPSCEIAFHGLVMASWGIPRLGLFCLIDPVGSVTAHLGFAE
jgi:hypothetical protein